MPTASFGQTLWLRVRAAGLNKPDYSLETVVISDARADKKKEKKKRAMPWLAVELAVPFHLQWHSFIF